MSSIPVTGASGSDLSMPALYYQRTSEEERLRHRRKLLKASYGKPLFSTEAAGRPQQPSPHEDEATIQKIQVEALKQVNGNWLLEVCTTDWPEPGLLDRLFEVLLRPRPGGLSIQSARMFTSQTGQVVNLFQLSGMDGLLTTEQATTLQQELSAVRPGERETLEIVQHLRAKAFIPRLLGPGTMFNRRLEDYSCLELRAERLSIRLCGVLLHVLSRSQLWLHVQVAEFLTTPDGRGLLRFFVMDKNRFPLRNDALTRLNMLNTLESAQTMVQRFNEYAIQRRWRTRAERGGDTLHHSRPRVSDWLESLRDVEELATQKGISGGLVGLERVDLLQGEERHILQRMRAFTIRHQSALNAVQETPSLAQVRLCRTYFQRLQVAAPLLESLFNQLLGWSTDSRLCLGEKHLAWLAGGRLRQLFSGTIPRRRFVLDNSSQLQLESNVQLNKPEDLLEAFYLLAATHARLSPQLMLQGRQLLTRTAFPTQPSLRQGLGKAFLCCLTTATRQANGADLLRSMRDTGWLKWFIPDFGKIEGQIHHTIAHRYTVDEHSILLVEILQSLDLLRIALPPGAVKRMKDDYVRLSGEADLKQYALKYALEWRMLQRAPMLRNRLQIRLFFQVMEDVHTYSLEHMMALNTHVHSEQVCLNAFSELASIRDQLDPFLHLYADLDTHRQTLLMLAALLHDIKKPAQQHAQLAAHALDHWLQGMGLTLPALEKNWLRWLIEHHQVLFHLQRSDTPVQDMHRWLGTGFRHPVWLQSLAIFTYADQQAMGTHTASHHAMLLNELLSRLPAKNKKAELKTLASIN